MPRKHISKGIIILQPQAQQIVYRIAISYTFGFIFTNIAFSIVTASFAETVKSAEPLSSVFLGYFFYREGTSIQTYLSLIPICTGVAISCIDDLSFNFYGFLAAAASNFCFSGRAVLTKHLFRKFPNCIDEISMFAQISKVGLIILIPFMILLESHMIISLLYNESYKVMEILILLILNGCAYSTYNVTSFLVLARTNLVTHAVFNCFRRVFIILFTCYYFQVVLSPLNIIGVGIAVIGVLFFAYSKHKDGK
jgi:solute carrier family 35 protein E1